VGGALGMDDSMLGSGKGGTGYWTNPFRGLGISGKAATEASCLREEEGCFPLAQITDPWIYVYMDYLRGPAVVRSGTEKNPAAAGPLCIHSRGERDQQRWTGQKKEGACLFAAKRKAYYGAATWPGSTVVVPINAGRK